MFEHLNATQLRAHVIAQGVYTYLLLHGSLWIGFTPAPMSLEDARPLAVYCGLRALEVN
jgi:hypothetical protein